MQQGRATKRYVEIIICYLCLVISEPLSARRKNTIKHNVATSILRPSVKPGRTQNNNNE